MCNQEKKERKILHTTKVDPRLKKLNKYSSKATWYILVCHLELRAAGLTFLRLFDFDLKCLIRQFVLLSYS